MKGNVMKSLWIFTAAITFSAFADLRPGVTYKGKFVEGKSKVYLMLRTAPGRGDSFLGVLQSKNQLVLYLIDRTAEGADSYIMTPFSTLNDGTIGIHNDDPSLKLMVLGEYLFDINVSNSGNNFGVTEAMRFNGKAKNFHWTKASRGKFSSEKVKHALSIANINIVEGEADAEFSSGLRGSYLLSEQFPGMYTVLAKKYLKWGQEIQRSPQRIGVFIKKKNREYFHLSDPNANSSIIVFKREK